MTAGGADATNEMLILSRLPPEVADGFVSLLFPILREHYGVDLHPPTRMARNTADLKVYLRPLTVVRTATPVMTCSGAESGSERNSHPYKLSARRHHIFVLIVQLQLGMQLTPPGHG